MQDDELPDDDPASFGDPLHPDDRLWRHPSEMRSVPPHGARSIPDTVDFAPTPRGRVGWTMAVASGIVGASAALLVVLATGMGDRTVVDGEQASGVDTVTTVERVSTTLPPGDATAAIAAVMPSVAQITVTTADGTVDGSAIVIRADGYLLTDAHVLAAAESIQLTLSDGSTLAGVLVASDPVTALAVVRVDRHDLVPATLGDPARLQVGQLAVVLGSHEGGGPSISSGVVSAFDERSTGQDGTPLYGLIRFDAPLPHGAAGGPLITESGEVVGITALASGESQSWGWATPIDDAEEIATDLIAGGSVQHAWLGVEGRRTAEGAAVMSVTENSPAHAAGLEVDDVLVSVDGRALASMATLVAIIRDHEPGDSISITYTRDGVEWTCLAVLGLRS